MKKNRKTEEQMQIRNNIVYELHDEIKKACYQERAQLMDISHQERGLYTRIAAGLKPVILAEFAMFSEIEQLGQVMENLNKIIMDPFKENNHDEEDLLLINAGDVPYLFTTPPSTPGISAMGSRRNSLRSENSFSRSPSVARSNIDDTGSFRSRNNSVSSQQVNNFFN